MNYPIRRKVQYFANRAGLKLCGFHSICNIINKKLTVEEMNETIIKLTAAFPSSSVNKYRIQRKFGLVDVGMLHIKTLSVFFPFFFSGKKRVGFTVKSVIFKILST